MADIKFGTDGWRAIFARDFTFQNCKVLCQSIATNTTARNLARQGLVVAYDHRFMAEDFARECARVIAGNGIKTYMMRKAAPTALAAFAVKELKAAGALVITAGDSSHEYCGIKYISSDAAAALPDLTEALEQEAQRVAQCGKIYRLDLDEAEKLELYKEVDMERAYLDSLKRQLMVEYFSDKNLKVVVDPLFGTGLVSLEKALQELGCEVKTIHNYRDPLFGGACPDPSENNLFALQRAVLSQQAEIGLAMDGDAGHFGIIDKDGTYIEPNMFLSILLNHLIETRSIRGAIARSQATTHLLDRIARKNGLQIIETPVGFKYLGQALRERACIIAGDECGSLGMVEHLPINDGILACLLAVEITAYSGLSLSQHQEQLLKEYGPVSNLSMSFPLNTRNIEDIDTALTGFNVRSLGGIKVTSSASDQGLKVVLENGNWILVRKSGNQDFLRLYVEGETHEQVEVLKDAIWEALGLKEIIS